MQTLELQSQEILALLKRSDINYPLENLYSEYFNEIVRLIEASGGNSGDGADIFQETILVFVDKVKTGQFRAESTIRTFLFAVAKNLWKEELRSRKRRNKRENIYIGGDNNAEHPEAEERHFRKDMQLALDRIYSEIGAVCQRILKGYYYEELSMRELLKEFNYENEQVLRNRKSLCMKKIKELLQKNNYLNTIFKNLTRYGR